MKTVLSLFAGGGGKTHGAIEAGYSPIGAVDNNPDACAHYRRNIGAIECGNLMQIEPSEFDKPDLLMASPPCPGFSQANVGAREGVMDVALSNRVVYYIRKLKPKAILIENVRQYANSQSFRELMAGIENAGYSYDIGVFNAADFGVPQGRVRLFVRAVRGKRAKIIPPIQTHSKNGGILPRWAGWYNAIADLIPDLPPSSLTPPQAMALNNIQSNVLVQRTGFYGGKPGIYEAEQPMGTLRASLGVDHKGYKRPKILDCWLRGGVQKRGVRSINNAALVRLQGWPDGLDWSGDCRIDTRILGNSVCPPIATALIRSMQVA
jgi:DNA (cytosine-5)-methyltransferase 1